MDFGHCTVLWHYDDEVTLITLIRGLLCFLSYVYYTISLIMLNAINICMFSFTRYCVIVFTFYSNLSNSIIVIG